MKPTYLLLTLLVAPGTTLAQASTSPAAPTASQPATFFGLKGGLSRSDLQSPNSAFLVSPFDYVLGLNAGVYGRHRFTRVASVQAELLYLRQGFQGDAYNRPAGAISLPLNHLDYLAVPVLFVGRITQTLSFQAGPQAAVLLAAHYEGQALSLSQSGYQRLDLGGVVGAELGVGPVHLGGRYEYSLPVLNATGAAVTATGQPAQVLPVANTYHHQVFQAYLGFDLPRSRRARS